VSRGCFPASPLVVVGGAAIRGGSGTYGGTLAGALLLTLLGIDISATGLAEGYKQIVYGRRHPHCAARVPPRRQETDVNRLRSVPALAAALITAAALSACADPDAGRDKIFLDLSYSGNNWQDEAANLALAVANSPEYAGEIRCQKNRSRVPTFRSRFPTCSR